jgi:hypothetical protein
MKLKRITCAKCKEWIELPLTELLPVGWKTVGVTYHTGGICQDSFDAYLCPEHVLDFLQYQRAYFGNFINPIKQAKAALMMANKQKSNPTKH